MGYIGSGPTRFNTADELTVTGDAEFNGNLTVKGTTTTLDSVTVQNFDIGDNDKIRLGDSQDLQIYHDGSNSFVNDLGTGNLVIRGANVTIQDASANNQVFVNNGGAVDIRYAGSAKLTTTATGIDVTGTIISEATNPTVKWVTAGGGATEEAYIQKYTDDVYFYNKESAGNIYFGTNNQTKVTLNSSGNVGIGATPVSSLQVSKTQSILSGTSNGYGVHIYPTSSGDTYIDGITSGAGGAGISLRSYYNGTYNKIISGNTQADTTTFQTGGTERMRIDSSGNVLVGTTTSTIVNATSGTVIRSAGYTDSKRNTTSSASHLQFYNPNGYVGSVQTSGSSTSYNTSSDYRLKTNVNYDWDATSRLKQLKPARFEWIADGDDAVPVDGFLAHEVEDIVPEAITGTKDAMRDEEYEVTPAVLDDDGNEVTPAVMGTRSVPDYQGIDQAKLVPLLVKTIQELEARITALESA